MGQLSKQLTTYCIYKNQKIIFNKKFTLNTLAAEMRKHLNHKKIDKSVVSRVLKGERLFTVEQLHVFCDVLEITEEKRQTLFQALQADYLQKKGSLIELQDTSLADKIEIIDDLINEAFLIFYDGRCRSLSRLIKLIDTYLSKLTLSQVPTSYLPKVYELIGLKLYLQGRFMGCMELSDTVVNKISKLAKELFLLGNMSKLDKLHAYANISLSDAYYIAGGYSKDKKKKKFYKNAIAYSKKAIPFLNENDHNRILALRTIAASAIYLEDKETFLALKKTAEEIVEQQPLENRVYTLQFCATIATGNASFGFHEPFQLKDKGINHFKSSLQGCGAFEVSDIRAELETLSLGKSSEKQHIKSLLVRGSILAEQENMIRYKDYFNTLSHSL